MHFKHYFLHLIKTTFECSIRAYKQQRNKKKSYNAKYPAKQKTKLLTETSASGWRSLARERLQFSPVPSSEEAKKMENVMKIENKLEKKYLM
jgi:hypothetical protein